MLKPPLCLMFVLLFFKGNELADLFYLSLLGYSDSTPLFNSSRRLACIEAKAVP
jgi:hypothetical protein